MSNGYGEDRSAALIASELKSRCSSVKVTGAPLITAGKDFMRKDIPVITQGQIPPSGGFPTMSVKGFLCDLPFTHRHINYYRALRDARDDIDHLVVIGDVFLLFMAWLACRGKAIIHFSLPKSDYNNPHFGIEEFIFRKIPHTVMTRDEHTCTNLKAHGVNAVYVGNPIMDDLSPKGIELGNSRIVGVLPGSRTEAYENLRMILRVVERVSDDVVYACALSPALETERIVDMASHDGWLHENSMLRKERHSVQLVKNGFEDVITKAEIVIGLAGTANEQAVGLGKPAVSFMGTGPQTTAKRMKDQERMLGGAVRYIADFPDGVAAEISMLLSDPIEREKRGKIGALRMGAQGASGRVADFLIKEFNLPRNP